MGQQASRHGVAAIAESLHLIMRWGQRDCTWLGVLSSPSPHPQCCCSSSKAMPSGTSSTVHQLGTKHSHYNLYGSFKPSHSDFN